MAQPLLKCFNVVLRTVIPCERQDKKKNKKRELSFQAKKGQTNRKESDEQLTTKPYKIVYLSPLFFVVICDLVGKTFHVRSYRHLWSLYICSYLTKNCPLGFIPLSHTRLEVIFVSTKKC